MELPRHAHHGTEYGVDSQITANISFVDQPTIVRQTMRQKWLPVTGRGR